MLVSEVSVPGPARSSRASIAAAGKVGQELAVALGRHWLGWVHVELLERGRAHHREGVQFGAERAQRADQVRARALLSEVGGLDQGEGPAT